MLILPLQFGSHHSTFLEENLKSSLPIQPLLRLVNTQYKASLIPRIIPVHGEMLSLLCLFIRITYFLFHSSNAAL